jgi:hypothetical protein
MTIGPIPRSAINDYADREGMDEDEADFMRAIIRIADNAYLRMLSPKKTDSEFSNVANMNDPKAVRRLLEGFNARYHARERRKRR